MGGEEVSGRGSVSGGIICKGVNNVDLLILLDLMLLNYMYRVQRG